MQRRWPKSLAILCCLALPNLSWGGTTLTLWNIHDAHEYIERISKEYFEQQDIEIEVSTYLLEPMKTELLARKGRSSMPDMLIVPADFLGMHVELDFIPLDDSWSLNLINDSARQSANLNNTYYGLPLLQGNHLMLYYNKQWVKTPAKNWQAMFDQQSKLAKQGVETIVWEYDQMFWFMPFYGAFGGNPVIDGDVNLDNPAMVSALDAYKNLYDKGLVRRDCDNYCAESSFKAGKQAYVITGDWALSDFSEALGENLGIAELPAIGELKLVPMSSSYVLVVPGQVDGARLAEIKKYAQHLVSYETQIETYNETKLLPTNAQAFDQVSKNSSGLDREILNQFAQGQGMPIDPAMGIAWEVMTHSFRRFMDQGFSAWRTAKYMQQLADKVSKQRAEE
ncbi:sugar ABC transporter substrate-binding protein [Alginatibacterium sediminis]|uniref:sugar ABC transporter substrate-binding protein n=1 Tax=Alginatibacterium sediminis TaxID=2164068 RepID=UPI0013147A25|nr:extracellular solute-binding protein [Alginatibacterium sediminis]